MMMHGLANPKPTDVSIYPSPRNKLVFKS